MQKKGKKTKKIEC